MPCLHSKLSVRRLLFALLMAVKGCGAREAASRQYTTFTWKEADLRICSPRADVIMEEVKRLRSVLEDYISRHAEFRTSLVPLKLLPGAPDIALRMAAASESCGVGPMAAVAGAVAEMAAEAAVKSGADEAIVENGGDIFLHSPAPVSVGLYAGENPLSGQLAFHIEPSEMPVAVCSSSGRFGHSLSFGQCDLATVVATSGALADAAATLAGNCVKSVSDIEPTLKKIVSISGIVGVFIIKEDKIGMAGSLPRLVKCDDPDLQRKARHP
jgi:ApbE superfamily uncharacterized protein (UPF0280 family)